MKKVLVRSMLGLLGDLENKVCYLHSVEFDIEHCVEFAVVSLTPEGKKHEIALEHLAEYVEDAGGITVDESNGFESKLKVILSDIEKLLVSKNKKYGNSAS